MKRVILDEPTIFVISNTNFTLVFTENKSDPDYLMVSLVLPTGEIKCVAEEVDYVGFGSTGGHVVVGVGIPDWLKVRLFESLLDWYRSKQ